jgi:hypothetical protein
MRKKISPGAMQDHKPQLVAEVQPPGGRFGAEEPARLFPDFRCDSQFRVVDVVPLEVRVRQSEILAGRNQFPAVVIFLGHLAQAAEMAVGESCVDSWHVFVPSAFTPVTTGCCATAASDCGSAANRV